MLVLKGIILLVVYTAAVIVSGAGIERGNVPLFIAGLISGIVSGLMLVIH